MDLRHAGLEQHSRKLNPGNILTLVQEIQTINTRPNMQK